MPVEKNKVELKPIIEDSLVELIVQDIQGTKTTPIPLPLAHLAEKCLPIYKRFEKIYNDNGIDYSDTGEKNIKDVEEAIKHLRNLEVEKTSWEDKLRGTMFGWHYPPVDGSSTILLTEFTDDVLSLTKVPETKIKIRLEKDVIGIAPISSEEGQ